MRKFTHQKIDRLVRLWVHEVARVFTDRLSSEDDQMKVYKYLATPCRMYIKEDLPSCLRRSLTDRHKENNEHVENALDVMTEHIRFSDLLDTSKKAEDRQYDEVLNERYKELISKLKASLEEFNSGS